jgi:hypothetical protein
MHDAPALHVCCAWDCRTVPQHECLSALTDGCARCPDVSLALLTSGVTW